MVILSLIVKRARVKALVKDKRAALEAFGTYVEVGGFVCSSKITSRSTYVTRQSLFVTLSFQFPRKNTDFGF